ncbi:dihydrofolate reductase [Modestobacter sp. I12A-02628]|uniref:Dihydrofolate reductase n=1 Tax=Goekera deserti TaxID=2497753 RepID=A0A7K3WBT6_9ACTN|nr:dihydrofolate reductase family protein [Goekera deserti]MPQ98355.1 dihydrofolate reductase [Goekera deserti]NDI48182.1 dihydrofolate reductase [Goekera deserti]NEL53931.1 dihydrofolate reductase [Goekera deserti]
MTRTVYYTATSLDGFVADAEHSLSWLLSREADHEGVMGYQAFERTVGALVMGASTYRWIQDHGGPEGWTYTQPAQVLTHRELAPFPGADIRFRAADSPEELRAVHAELVAAAGERDVWVVGGGPVAAQFAAAGLLDEVVVSIAPVTLGAGAPLLPARVELVVREVARNGEFACVRYDVVRPG